MRKGKAGTLYLTIAPSIGVVRPIRSNIRTIKMMEKMKGTAGISFILLLNSKLPMITKTIRTFSMALIRIRGDDDSHIEGLVSTVNIARGE